ncbi:MAG TPA: hypothetical protein VHC22_25590 [Pirellulales bacterium]|nr:hypothetical protein [Pirellulales bacterium]
MTNRQSATILVLLTALYGVALILLSPRWELVDGNSVDTLLAGTAIGLLIAGAPFLAVWSVHSSSRAAVRLPVTAWLLAVFCLAATYGTVRVVGQAEFEYIALATVVLPTSYAAIWIFLRLLRAIRGWRLHRVQSASSSTCAVDTSGPEGSRRQRQFTIRTLLAWTFAAAALCAGLRWLAPYGAFDTDDSPVALLQFTLVEGGVGGLMLALAGLPVLSVAWVVLADGRRTILRCVLVAITILGIGGGIAALAWWSETDQEELVMFVAFALSVEVSMMAAALAGVSIVRACGYRLVRLKGKAPAPTAFASSGALGTRRFAWTLAPIVLGAVLLACSAPLRFGIWRLADERQYWTALGWEAAHDAEGHIASLASHTDCDLAGTAHLLASVPHLKALNLSNAALDDAQLSKLPSLTELTVLTLDGAGITDAGLPHLQRFPNVKTLKLLRANVTDAGLWQLRVLTKLTALDLSETSISFDALEPIDQLEDLNLEGTGVNDRSLARLGCFPNLKSLGLVRTEVSDDGLHELGVLKSLHTLDLRMTDVGDGAVAPLSQMVRLKRIDLQLTALSEAGSRELQKALPAASVITGANDSLLRGAVSVQVRNVVDGQEVYAVVPKTLKRLHARGSYPTHDVQGNGALLTVTDAGLAALSGQTSMEELDLRESGVTDAGLASLFTLASLKRLDVRGTRVTESGCGNLAKILPNCTILR